MAKEKTPGLSLRGLPASDGGAAAVGLFVWQNSSICGAYIPPRRWVCCWQGLLLFRFARNLCWQGCVAGGKNFCFRLLRAPSVLVLGLPSTNAKAEYARLRANMSEAGAQRRLRIAGIQGEPLARFLGSFFAAWQRMNIKNQTAQREPKARSMSVRLRKKQKILPKKEEGEEAILPLPLPPPGS